jgi:hypothetical protein
MKMKMLHSAHYFAMNKAYRMLKSKRAIFLIFGLLFLTGA